MIDRDLPLVTIVTPSLNQGRFIRETIESVLTQDYPNIEYIVMDGGSTDETATICAEYKDRLTFISESDRGQSDAINKGFAMARGEIVAWLNSDDIFLPGAIRRAVEALTADPSLAMVYGEGYQLDVDGKVISHFNPTQRFDLWKLAYVSDYILQQTTFFRKWALDAVGPLDETLHFTLDWDIFIRIGKRFPVGYIPEDMGAIREYADAKSFSGGPRRFREIAKVLRRHGKRRYPPAYFVYGLVTYEKIWNAKLAAIVPSPFSRPRQKLQRLVTRAAHRIIGLNVRHSQGWYADGWAGPRTHIMLQPPRGRYLEIEATLPRWVPAERQTIEFESEGQIFARETFDKGRFTIAIPVPERYWDEPFEFTMRAAKTFRSARETKRMQRKLAFILHGVRYGALQKPLHAGDQLSLR